MHPCLKCHLLSFYACYLLQIHLVPLARISLIYIYAFPSFHYIFLLLQLLVFILRAFSFLYLRAHLNLSELGRSLTLCHCMLFSLLSDSLRRICYHVRFYQFWLDHGRTHFFFKLLFLSA